ncbi:MAG: dTDP-4-dehydrorhamnose 3,5-epimerase [Candidatus Binatia bacterium]|nr:dTDP-4-dehydrorhamnose 3,5-epimerase [Candidatus Binatia bacterium]
MRLVETELPGVVIVEPEVHRDERGFFLETFHGEKYAKHGLPRVFVQDNHSRSVRGTVRGLHAQLRRPQGKLVRVIAGAVWDVAVDIRRGSPWFGRWTAVTLSAENFRQLYVPPGFAHGFCVLSDAAEVEYKCTDYYDPEGELRLAWNDPELAIPWPVRDPVLSEKDRTARPLRELAEVLPRYVS